MNDKGIKEVKILSYCYGFYIGQNRMAWSMVGYGREWTDLPVEISR